MKKILPETFYNRISLVGAVIAVFNTGFIVFLTVLEIWAKQPKPPNLIVVR
jgi:hypothetical protein